MPLLIAHTEPLCAYRVIARQVCNEGPKEKLDDTVYSQVPAPLAFAPTDPARMWTGDGDWHAECMQPDPHL